MDADDDEESDAEQLADYLVTLSRLPNSRWKNLVHLDTIKVTRHRSLKAIWFTVALGEK